MTNEAKIELNKEVNKIIAMFRKDRESGYTFLSTKQETKLLIRIQELERKLNTTIVIQGIYNHEQGY